MAEVERYVYGHTACQAGSPTFGMGSQRTWTSIKSAQSGFLINPS